MVELKIHREFKITETGIYRDIKQRLTEEWGAVAFIRV